MKPTNPPIPRVGIRHALYTRRSKSTGRLLLVLEHELHGLAESEITRELLEAFVTELSKELAGADTAITNLVKSNAAKDATIAERDATIADLKSQLDVANQKDLANPLNDPDTRAAADKLNATLAGLPADVLPPAPPADAPPAATA